MKNATGWDRPMEMEGEIRRWSTGHFVWRWQAAMGVNLSVREDKEGTTWRPCVFMKTLALAGMFAEGFECGWEAANRKEQPDPDVGGEG